jgi:hypothetical protein
MPLKNDFFKQFPRKYNVFLTEPENFYIFLQFLFDFSEKWYIVYTRKQVNLGTRFASGPLLGLLFLCWCEIFIPAFFFLLAFSGGTVSFIGNSAVW